MPHLPFSGSVRGAMSLAAVALAVLPAQMSAAAAEPVVSLQDQVRSGTMDSTHGSIGTCGLCLSRLVTAAPGSADVLSTDTPVGWGAHDLAAALHLPGHDAGHGRRGTVAIISGGAYPTEESDLAVYRAQYGLPACTVADGCLTITDLDGGPPLAPTSPKYDQAGAAEAAMDVDMASAACPSCRIIDVQAPAVDAIPGPVEQLHRAMGDFAHAVDTALRSGADAVSMSFGLPNDNSPEARAIDEELFHPGAAILAASGDGGFRPTNEITWPADLPWVTAVGGVTLTRQGTHFTQTAWVGAGSGCDTNQRGAFGAPRAVSALCGGHRAAADVSAVADDVAAYLTYAPYSHRPPRWIAVGGTSLSSPFVAGLYARGGHTWRVVGPNTLYGAPRGAFTDVTTGQNVGDQVEQQSCPADTAALCMSGQGWDGPTGVGTPDGLSGF